MTYAYVPAWIFVAVGMIAFGFGVLLGQISGGRRAE